MVRSNEMLFSIMMGVLGFLHGPRSMVPLISTTPAPPAAQIDQSQIDQFSDLWRSK